MFYREIKPPANLGSLIDRFWILESDGEQAAVQRVVRTGVRN